MSTLGEQRDDSKWEVIVCCCGSNPACGKCACCQQRDGSASRIDLPGVGVVGDSMPLKEILWDVVKLWDIGAFMAESAFRESVRIAMDRLKRAHLEMR